MSIFSLFKKKQDPTKKKYKYTGPILREGNVKKGGVGSPPTKPKPLEHPKGQGGKDLKGMDMVRMKKNGTNKKPTTPPPGPPKGQGGKKESDIIIEGKVAYFSYQEEIIVLNIGTNAGIEEGMCFSICEKKVAINDPVTGEFLDTICLGKMIMKTYSVMDNICIGWAHPSFPIDPNNILFNRVEIGDVAKRMIDPLFNKASR